MRDRRELDLFLDKSLSEIFNEIGANSLSMMNDMFDVFEKKRRDMQNIRIERQYTPEGFIKTYLSQSTNLDPRTINIFTHMIIEASKSEDKLFHGTYDSLMERFRLSRAPIAESMKILQENGYITKTPAGYKITDEVSFPDSPGSITISFKRPGTEEEKPVEEFKPADKDILAQYGKAYLESYRRYGNSLSEEEEKKILEEVSSLADKYNTDKKLEEDGVGELALQIFKNGFEAEKGLKFIPEIRITDENLVVESFKKLIEKAHISKEHEIIVLDKLLMAYKILGRDRFTWVNLHWLFTNYMGNGRKFVMESAKRNSLSKSRSAYYKNQHDACISYYSGSYFNENGVDYDSLWAQQLRGILSLIYLNCVIVDYDPNFTSNTDSSEPAPKQVNTNGPSTLPPQVGVFEEDFNDEANDVL